MTAWQICVKKLIQHVVLSRFIDSLLQCHFGILLCLYVFTYFVTGQFIQQGHGTIPLKACSFLVGLPGRFGPRMLCPSGAVRVNRASTACGAKLATSVSSTGCFESLSKGLKGWGKRHAQVLLQSLTSSPQVSHGRGGPVRSHFSGGIRKHLLNVFYTAGIIAGAEGPMWAQRTYFLTHSTQHREKGAGNQPDKQIHHNKSKPGLWKGRPKCLWECVGGTLT